MISAKRDDKGSGRILEGDRPTQGRKRKGGGDRSLGEWVSVSPSWVWEVDRQGRRSQGI